MDNQRKREIEQERVSENLSVLSSVQLDWKFVHGLDPADRTKWELHLRWFANDGEHEYAACVPLDKEAVKTAYNLIIQAHQTLRVLKEEGVQGLRPGRIE